MKAGSNKTNEIELEGKVIMAPFGKGSKSQHESVCLRTDKETFKLRRMQGNAFHDPVLLEWVGKEVIACGILADYLFIATDLKEKELIEPEEKIKKKKKKKS
ncbi:MAG: hypothetical protein H0V30_01465 [Chitinophagaceae bacterium]|jgi:hypothetical protein|nr:hypothetical protein [Chitinophagaceae bacterium]